MSKYLALELSDKNIRYCFLEKAVGRPRLSQAGSIDLGEAQFSSESFAKALSEILTKIGTSRVKLFVNILRRETLINSVILPQMPSQELDEVINGEIIKIPSFYGKEYDFTYASYPYVDTKIRVVYCAIFRDIVKGITTAAKGLKIDLEEVALAPVSLLANAYTWGENLAEQVLVVVEETSSYVVAFQNKQCKFFFSGAMGRTGLFKTGTCDRLSMMTWATDINRVITSYFVAHGGQAVQKVYLIWDDEGALGLAEALEEQLGKPVVKPDLKMFLETEGSAMANPAYLIALSPVVAYLGKLKSEFSFGKFLESFNFKDQILKMVLQLAGFVAVCALMVSLIGKLAVIQNHKATLEVKLVKDKIEILQTENQKHSAEAALADGAQKDILTQISTVNEANKISWTKVFDEVVKRLPQGISFTSFKVMDDGRVDIEGQAYAIETIGSFMHRLGDIDLLQDIKVSEIKDTQMEQMNNDQSQKKIFSFEITADLVK